MKLTKFHNISVKKIFMYNYLMILEILLPINTDKTFYYKSKKNLKIGTIVKVIFRGKKTFGIVWKITSKIEFNKPLNDIEEFYDNCIFSSEVIQSINFSSIYFCGKKSKFLKHFLSSCPKILEGKNELIKKQTSNNFLNAKLKLTSSQRKAIKSLDKISNNEFSVSVLDGITGSGKTRVYMNKILETIKNGYQSLILVPEKILTEQWVKEIQEDFKVKALIYHSSIKKSKKESIWMSTMTGSLNLVVGTRSSLFLPFQKLGLIVVDEEHDPSYKQQEQLILNFRDFAIVRSKNSSCPIILSSATPSVESYFNYKKGKYIKVDINERVNKSNLPEISSVDMKREKNDLISKKLIDCIKRNLKLGFQTLLFINKRGYAPFVICKKCGEVKICSNCNFPFVLHNYVNKNSYLLCHQCNTKKEFSNECEKCKSSKSMIFPGIGIEKIYEELKNQFPNAKICLLSSDQIKGKGALKKILDSIYNNEVDIILGTQLVSKGHNFPFLKTVGIINIDNLLNDFDFRSHEKTYQQITQVAGRAGRKEFEGEVFIQTLQPSHPIIELSKTYDKSNFFEWELKNRKKNFQPPYSNLISIVVESHKNDNAKSTCSNIKSNLKKKFLDLNVYGPAPSVIFMRNKMYRYRILVKLKKNHKQQKQIKNYLSTFLSTKTTKIYVDVDPINFL